MTANPTSSALQGASDYHIPVLPVQVLEAFDFSDPEGRTILDATAGGGGHSELLLQKGFRVIALDRDLDSLKETAERLSSFGPAFTSVHSNFSDLDKALDSLGITTVDGILADFGVSSHQLDEAERGFSFMRSGPLDMRMDQTQELTAKMVVETYSEQQLCEIFRDYGEEKKSRKIARCIVQDRDSRDFQTTLDLADYILKLVGKREKIHPATRVFQALRIEVNNELGEIKTFMKKSVPLLNPGGRLALISFHSLEDRLVKRFIAQHSARTIDRPEWPEARPNPDYFLTPITKKPLIADASECASNVRSRISKH